jgi:hypothetical protein
MIQCREQLGFALKPREAIRIMRKRLQQDLQRDVPLQLRVARAIDLAHAARAERGQDFVRAESRTRGQRHASRLILATAPLSAKSKSPRS